MRKIVLEQYQCMKEKINFKSKSFFAVMPQELQKVHVSTAAFLLFLSGFGYPREKYQQKQCFDENLPTITNTTQTSQVT